MYMVRITTDKLSNLAENAEKMLRYGGKVMQCLDELQREGGEEFGERGYGSYGNRYGMRGGYREEFDDMGERRGVPGSGRGYRY